MKLTISKLDSARRQLETAVRLYFFDVDPVSTHTLAAAAYGVLRDLNTAQGGEPMMEESLREVVTPEFQPKLREFLREAQNFFKHADRDSTAVLDFNLAHTEIMLLDACWTYHRLSGERLPLLSTLEAWGALTFARSYVHYDWSPSVDKNAVQRFGSMKKSAFFEMFLPIACQAGWTRRV